MTPEESDEGKKKEEKKGVRNVRGEGGIREKPKLVISYYIQVYCKGCGET